jgi:hypothetical protein
MSQEVTSSMGPQKCSLIQHLFTKITGRLEGAHKIATKWQGLRNAVPSAGYAEQLQLESQSISHLVAAIITLAAETQAQSSITKRTKRQSKAGLPRPTER